SSQGSFRKLLEVRLIRVIEVWLEVAEGRRHRVETVGSDGGGVRVAQFRERLCVEPKITVRVVALRRGDVSFVRERLSGQQADARVVPAFGQVVADLQAVLAAAEFARRLRGKVIRKCQKDFCAEGLEQRPPAVAGQGRTQGADALRCDDRDALRL